MDMWEPHQNLEATAALSTTGNFQHHTMNTAEHHLSVIEGQPVEAWWLDLLQICCISWQVVVPVVWLCVATHSSVVFLTRLLILSLVSLGVA
jgi:hypothetical protein